MTGSTLISVPLPGTAVLIISALIGAWVSDGPLKGRRWPIIYFGAVVMLASGIALKVMPLYTNLKGHFAVYYLFNMGVSTFFRDCLLESVSDPGNMLILDSCRSANSSLDQRDLRSRS